MTTLSADKVRDLGPGDHTDLPVIASDIIYGGAAIGIVSASGHARPLVGTGSVDTFGGFALRKCDNSTGSAADKYVKAVYRGVVANLAVTGALITDVGLPVYAQDDDTFSFVPTDGVFVGFVKRFVSAGVVDLAFDAMGFRDPWGHYSVRETLTGTKIFDIEDSGKLFSVTDAGDGDALTLPAIADAPSGLTILAVGAFGTTAVTVDPNASDGIAGPNMAITANKDLILTKATQRRHDFVTLSGIDNTDGYIATELRGIWAKEA